MGISFDVLEAMVPEAAVSLKERYSILECISLNQPIGRRALALECNISERHARTETELLCESGKIKIDQLHLKKVIFFDF